MLILKRMPWNKLQLHSFTKSITMSFYNTIVRELEAGRMLDKELAVDRYKQQLEREKLTKQIDTLNHSRRLLIQKEIDDAKKQYEDKLLAEKELAEELHLRQSRAAQQRNAVLRKDITREREQLLEEDRRYAKLQGEFTLLQNDLTRLKSTSRVSYEEEKRALDRLEARKSQTLSLIDESKKRQALLLNQLDELRLRL